MRERLYTVYFDMSTRTYTFRTWFLDGSLYKRREGFETYKSAKNQAIHELG